MATYKRIGAVSISISIIRFLADQREPVSGRDVARALDIKYDTLMCYLASLEDERFARRIGEYYELGQDAAMIWAKRKTQIETKIDRNRRDLAELEG